MSIFVDSLPATNLKYQPLYKWLLAVIVPVVLLCGWRFPALGFFVPVAMVSGMAGGLFRGRWVCGNLCPRGGLLDTWLGALPRRPVPAWLTAGWLRWGVLALLIGLMVGQLASDPGNWRHWGVVFWRMCLLTTVVAVGLAVSFAPRSWCRVCPVGTVAAKVGGDKLPLQIAKACRNCRVCEKVCPMQFDIAASRHEGRLSQPDCLKCSTCLKSCPRQVLSWSV